MKRLLLVLFATLPSLVLADAASHRQAATEMLNLVSGPETMRAGVNSVLEPMLVGLRERGATDAMVDDVRAAFNAWFEEEIRWDDLRPKLVDLYVAEFSESEIRDLVTFYRSPAGSKALKALPRLFGEGARIGQAYAKTKEAALQERLRKVIDKHQKK